MTACLLYDKIHKNQAENLLHLMLYFSIKACGQKSSCNLLCNLVYCICYRGTGLGVCPLLGEPFPAAVL